MGLTPIEDHNDGGEQSADSETPPGVFQQVRTALSGLVGRVADGLWGLLGSPNGRGFDHRSDGRSEREHVSDATAIKPGGQARLESGTDTRQEQPTEATPAHRRELDVEGRLQDGTLRVYDPDSQDAYVSSDVYERIER